MVKSANRLRQKQNAWHRHMCVHVFGKNREKLLILTLLNVIYCKHAGVYNGCALAVSIVNITSRERFH